MITLLKGVLLEKKESLIVVEVSGIGYEVEVPLLTFRKLPEVGASLVLHTYYFIREDAHVLYGFATTEERSLFRQLIKVNGVGPKLAMGILSHLSVGEFVHWVQSENIETLVKVPGIGRKTAERLVVELRGKLIGLPQKRSTVAPSSACIDATRALIALGFKPQEASRLVLEVETPNLDGRAMLRLALKRAARARI